MTIPKNGHYDSTFVENCEQKWRLLRDRLENGDAGCDIIETPAHETAVQQNLSSDDTAKTLTESAAKIYKTLRKIWGIIGTVQMFNRQLETGFDITCNLARIETQSSHTLYQLIEVINRILFHTPLFFLIRSNHTLSDAKACWDFIKSSLTLAGRIKRSTANAVDLMNWGSNLFEIYVRIGLRRSTQPSQWAERDFFLQLQLFNDFNQFGLSLVPERVLEGESQPAAFTIRTRDITAFIERLNAQETVQLPLEAREKALRELLAHGVTCDTLLNLPRIPTQLYHDRVLSKYLCTIEDTPVRFPAIIRVRGEIKLCDRRNLEQWYGPITNCLPASSRSNNRIPGLNCFAREITILKRLEPQILNKIESRLTLLSTVLADIEGKPFCLPAENHEGLRANLRNWVIHRIKHQAVLTERLIELVDSVAATPITTNGQFYEYYYQILARLCVIASYKTTTTYSWLENRFFKWMSINLLGADPKDLDALDRKHSNLLRY